MNDKAATGAWRRPAAAAVALMLLAALVGLAVGALLAASPPSGEGAGALAALGEPYVWRVARFTLWQAALSALLSVLFALPVARAFARRGRFAGRGAFLRLISLPLAIPQLVAVLGILSAWGRNGWLADAMAAMGLEQRPDIYGLGGILLAHVFFNMPLAARLFIGALERLPDEYWRLSAQLGMGPAAIWRHVEWPALRVVLPGVLMLIFMLCAASFTVVLTLGGGPAATTLEVAIYQALRFDFDPPRAVALALLQLLLSGALFIALRRFSGAGDTLAGLGRAARRFDGAGPMARLTDGWWLGLAALYVGLPLLGVIVSGLGAELGRLLTETALHRALVTSLLLALAAAGLALLLTWGLLSALRGARGEVAGGPPAVAADVAASLVLAVPPLVVGAGWFVLLRPAGRLDLLGPLVVAVINAVMALPFAWRVLMPAFREAQNNYGRLCAQLGIGGLARLRLVDWPLLRRPLGLAGALAMALSIGDLGAIAMFGSENFRTLPWLLYSRLGSYRTEDAAGLALILLVFILLLMLLAERLAESGERR